MNKKHILTLGFLLLFGTQTYAQAQTFQGYLPSAIGNEWTYEVSGGAISGTQNTIRTIRQSNGWVRFEGVPGWGEGWIWESHVSGRAWVWNPNIGTYALWMDLGVGQGQTFTVEQHAGMGCWDGSTYTIQNEDFEANSPVGNFNHSLEIVLVEQNCADAGVIRMVFAPGFGIVEYETQSIAGPRRWVIQHALVNGREYNTNPFRGGLRTSANLDRAVYGLAPQQDGSVVPDTMTVELEILNGTSAAIDYTYFSAQTFDIFITDEQGTEVYRWSFGKAFPLPVIAKKLAPGERIVVGDTFELRDNDGQALPPGNYKVEIVHMGEGLDASVTTPFQIQESGVRAP